MTSESQYQSLLIIIVVSMTLTITGTASGFPHKDAAISGFNTVSLDRLFEGNNIHVPSFRVQSNSSVQSNDLNSLGQSSFTTDKIVVGMLLVLLLAFLIWEPIRIDLIAITMLILLIVLNQWTGVSVRDGLSGFSSPATITVLAMFILSEGVRKTGFVQVLVEKLSEFTKGSDTRQLAVVTGLSSSVAGIVNNTPVVAIFVPMVTKLARKTRTSPSKLLIPLSFASMLGGTLTVLGTSTNLLASDISERLIDHPFSMFEFTQLGVIVLVSGVIYLLTVGHRLIPERIDPQDEITEEYEMGEFLTEVVVEDDSRLIGNSVDETLNQLDIDMDLVQIIRDGDQFMEPLDIKVFQPGDHLIIRANEDTLLKLLETEGLELLPEIDVTEKSLEEPIKGQKVIEVMIPKGSYLEGDTLTESSFLDRYDVTVLAVRRGGELTHEKMKEYRLNAGDVLLVFATEDTVSRLRANRNFIIAREMEPSDYRRSKTWTALGIVACVVGVAASGLVSIVVSALAGVVAMVASGCLKPEEVYSSVDWEIIFLLAGLIPFGIALQETGTADYLAHEIIRNSTSLPPIGLLAVFYVLTVILTNVISNNASVVLMVPIAVDAATQLGLNPFAFVLAVTFAASTAFLTPVGYQTNLMVYGPGGYRFRDFMIVGAPLQVLLAVVTPLGISLFWSVT